MRRAIAILTLACLAGCSTREHANPLDPRNTETGGRPASFAAIAENGQVYLTWTAEGVQPGLQFQLYRKLEGQADYTALTQALPGTETSYLDLGLINGVTYRYRLYFVVDGVRSGLPSEDLATPSPVLPWIVDDARLSLIRLSADGRRIAVEAQGFAGPTDCEVDRVSHIVWVVDEAAGRAVIFNPALASGFSIRGLGDPAFVAVDQRSGAAWVSNLLGDEVFQLLPDGSFGTPPTIPSIDAPLGLDVNPADHSLWVCERRGGNLRHYKSDGSLLGATPFPSPSRVAVDTLSGEVWATSFETRQVLHVSATGAPLDTLTNFSGPVGIDVDESRGRIWVADPVAGQVIALRRSGSEEFRVNGLPGARELAVESLSGEAWVVMNGTVARVSSTGAVVLAAQGLSDPVAITLDRFGP